MNYINDVHKALKQYAHTLNLLRFNRGIDRAEMSRKLQVSMPTIYKAMDELSSLGVINKSENSISINKNFAYLIGISIGSALCKVSFLDMTFNLLSEDEFAKYKIEMCERIENVIKDAEYDMDLLKKCKEETNKNYIYFKTPNHFHELKNVLDSIFGYIQECIVKELYKVLSIGISCTGVINYRTQTILSAHNLEYLNDSTLDTLIFPDKQQFFGANQIFVSLVQNSAASVIAEKIDLYQNDSVYKHKQNIISLYLGVGVGAGIYLNRMYSGTNGYSGEIGHTKAPVCDMENTDMCSEEAKGKLDDACTCGNEECFDYKIRTYVFGKSKQEFCDMTSEEMKKHLEVHPERAKLLGTYLGHMVNTLTSLLDIDLIIFTGKFYKFMDLIYNDIVLVQDKNKLKYSRNDCTLLTSGKGSLSPAIGAAIYSYHKRFGLDLSWDYE